ncbi:uncharacterized protein IL334_000975 [Kwoniella shivajii]|uniref:Myb-like domain-containing protein n=1 Tax=Kwoniella shivajii TaxID=564305 RepID=A0ABZ1CUW5_9TREE|nr:hypothetical protein IL334_000975 [Kwoniella shivajii]
MPTKKIKRSSSYSSASSPPSTPKKPKTKATPHKSPRAPTSAGGWTNDKKSMVMKRLFETGYKNMDWTKLAQETGMTGEQCKNQLTPGRNNLRKVILEMFV